MGCGASKQKGRKGGKSENKDNQGQGEQDGTAMTAVSPGECGATSDTARDDWEEEGEGEEEEDRAGQGVKVDKAAMKIQSTWKGFKTRTSSSVGKLINLKPPFYKLFPHLPRFQESTVIRDAWLMAKLSSLLYNPSATPLDKEDPVYTLEHPVTGEVYSVIRLAYALQTVSSPTPQWALFRIPALGILALAFRGTKTSEDARVDASFAPCGSFGRNNPFTTLHGDPVSVCLHGGIATSLHKYISIIGAALQQACDQYPDHMVYLTGHSLGGGYAISLLFMLLHSKSIQVEKVKVYTYGAPLVTSVPEHLQDDRAAVKRFLSLDDDVRQRGVMHHFVNRYDIVPRLLGQHSHLDSIAKASSYAQRVMKKQHANDLKEADSFYAIGHYYGILQDEDDEFYIRHCEDHETRQQFLAVKVKPTALAKAGPDHSMDSSDGYIARLERCMKKMIQ